ncbi:MAG: hypothetical protein HN348_30970, partial [Proteobacteria bacterium]|nr:hypothetical protein [Pseudomonadota bacterium]
MKVCRQCGETYTDRIDFCFQDGEVLQVQTLEPELSDLALDAPMPRAMRALQGGQANSYTRSATPVPRARRRSMFDRSQNEKDAPADEIIDAPAGTDAPNAPDAVNAAESTSDKSEFTSPVFATPASDTFEVGDFDKPPEPGDPDLEEVSALDPAPPRNATPTPVIERSPTLIPEEDTPQGDQIMPIGGSAEPEVAEPEVAEPDVVVEPEPAPPVLEEEIPEEELQAPPPVPTPAFVESEEELDAVAVAFDSEDEERGKSKLWMLIIPIIGIILIAIAGAAALGITGALLNTGESTDDNGEATIAGSNEAEANPDEELLPTEADPDDPNTEAAPSADAVADADPN